MCKSAKVSANILIYFAFEAIQGKKNSTDHPDVCHMPHSGHPPKGSLCYHTT